MEHLGDLSRFRRECIDAQKVFDYVIVNLEGRDDLVPFELPEGSSITETEICELITSDDGTPPDGRVTNVKTQIIIPDDGNCSAEVVGEDVVEVCGEDVTLQWVNITKETPLPFRVSFDIVDENNCVLLEVCGVGSINPIEEEQVLLCAPDGTTLDCTLLPSTTIRAFNFRCTDADQLRMSVRYNLCQAVQSYDDVKLEVIARLCEPRPIISPEETCEPVKPRQCPKIFPGPRNMD